ncbi:MAG: hypothetical protein KDD76_04625, partial [Rickettsiales bacterium]|nr:hypothetical protein [Rickettsiales bacterium]
KLLRLVVAGEEGTGKFARAMGYLVGGKTGTAEIAGGKSYDRKRMITSFTGAFPMDNPRYVVVTLFEEAKGTKDTWGYATAGWIAAPVMKEVVEHMAPLVGVAPVDEKDEKVQNLFAVDYAMSPSTRKRKSIAPQ